MQTLDQLSREQKLSPAQKSAIESYVSQLVVELLESIKQDNIQNFDETISSLSSQLESGSAK